LFYCLIVGILLHWYSGLMTPTRKIVGVDSKSEVMTCEIYFLRHWQNLNLCLLDCEILKVHMKCEKLFLTMPQLQNYQKHVWNKTMWAFFFCPCSSNFENLSQDLLLWWHCKCRLRATTTFLLHHSYELAASSVETLSSTKFELSRSDSCGLKCCSVW